MNYTPFIDSVIAKERGFVDNPADRGGPTNFGITEAVARANGYTGRMQDLPEAFAREIYLHRFVVEPGFDAVAPIDPHVAAELIDTGVNMGPVPAATFLQRCLNAFNQQQRRYPDVIVDGHIGRATLDALRAYCSWRGATGSRVLGKALNCLQGARYIEIAEHNPSQEAFTFGWFSERIEIPSS